MTFLSQVFTNLVNNFAYFSGRCAGTDEESKLIRTTESFVAVHDYSTPRDDDSSANDTRCCASERTSGPFIKPMAGLTTTQLSLSDYSLEKDLEKLQKAVKKQDKIVWISNEASAIQVRGENYIEDKKKVPSALALYELVKLDAVRSNSIYLDLGERYNLNEFMDKDKEQENENNNDPSKRHRRGRNNNKNKKSPKRPSTIFLKSKQDIYHTLDSNEKSWNAPTYLIITFLLPTSTPKIAKKANEKGYIVTAYYKMRDETQDILRIISNPNYINDEQTQLKQLGYLSNKNTNQIQRINAVKLWEKWCTQAPNDPEMQKRLKFIPGANNLQEIGVASWICKYNHKPMLIKRPGVTNFVFSHYQDDRMEIDINMHPLPFMFKQAMSHIHENYFDKMIMSFAFVIESRDEEELPEVLLGDPFILPFVDTEKVMKFGKVFGA